MKTPIILFTYNRPNHTDRLLSSLANCSRLDECELHIYCDGPKTPEHSSGVEASRSVVRRWASLFHARVIERDENLGLARSVVAGVTEACDRFGRVIVLEDDLELNPNFLNYMLQGLDHYQDDSRVYQISGYMFPITYVPKTTVLLLPLTTTWGWATWSRAWQSFDWNVPGAAEYLADHTHSRQFDLDGTYPFTQMFRDRLSGKIDSWGIIWWYTVFRAQGVVLYPKQSLVQNNGFDGSGRHGDATGLFYVSVDTQQDDFSGSISFPVNLKVDKKAMSAIKLYMRGLGIQGAQSSRLYSIRTLLAPIRDRVSRWIRQEFPTN